MQLDPHSLIKAGKIVEYAPPFTTFSEFLQKKSSLHPKKPALVYADPQHPLTLTYSELYRYTTALVDSLVRSYHLQPGDYISYAFENTPEIILLNYAAWSAGLISVPLDVKRDTLERKIYKLQSTTTKLFFTKKDPEVEAENARIKRALPNLTIIPTTDFSDFKHKLIDQSLATRYKLQVYPVAKLYGATSQESDKDCLILFTSGTTALPKGVRLNLKSLFANAESIADWLKFNDKDRFHILLPLHHINSTTFANTTILKNATIILSPTYSKSGFWKTMADYEATGASIVPTVAYDLLSEEKSFKQHQSQLKHVRRIQIGSAPVQPTVVDKFITKYSIPLYQGYGQTETSLRSTGVPMDLKPSEFSQIRKLNSLGTELKYTNVAILDPKGKELPQNQEGEICVRGPIIMAGYLDNPKANQEAFAHHWFHSGDTGYWQTHLGRKFFFLKGRTKEIIKKGGVLISPLAIENSLLKNYPDLDAVYAVGFPDARLGEEIGIVVVTKKPKIVDHILSLAKTCSLTGLSGYESPQAAIIVKDSDLPKTSTGKVQRVNIKAIFGPKLLQAYRTIYPSEPSWPSKLQRSRRRSGVAQTPSLIFRFLGPEEILLLKQAVTIHNHRWEENLKSNLTEFTHRAENGLLIAAINQKDQIVGTVSALKLSQSDLQKPFTQTYVGITGNGTLKTHNHKGDSLLCVAISTAPAEASGLRNGRIGSLRIAAKRMAGKGKVRKLTSGLLRQYLNSNKDPIISFHHNPKAGLNKGATIVKILKNSRPEDKASLGYNILMKYPALDKKPTINPQATIGTQLMEAALLYAYQQNLKHIYVYTRPATLSQYFSV